MGRGWYLGKQAVCWCHLLFSEQSFIVGIYCHWGEESGHLWHELTAGVFSCPLHGLPSWSSTNVGAILVPGIMYGVTVHSPAL